MDENKRKIEERAIKEAFTLFLSQEIPKEASFHKLPTESLVVRIFRYIPTDEVMELTGRSSILLNQDGEKSNEIHARILPVAKVLVAGPETDYKAGDLVKMRDDETRTIENPRYEMWNNTPYDKSNMEKVGEAPPKYINKFFRTYGPNYFCLNPLKVEPDADDLLTIKIHQNRVSSQITKDEFLDFCGIKRGSSISTGA